MAERSPSPPLAARLDQFRPSDIRRMFDLAEETEGDLVRLEIGEPDFDTPAHIVDAAAEAARGGATHYTHNNGIRELRVAIADALAREDGIEADPDAEIAVTVGAMQGVNYALQAITDPGDEVVVPTPGWPNYFTIADLVGVDAVEAPLSPDDAFDLDPERIARAISDATSVIVLPAPANPTGRIPALDAVQGVIELAARNDCYVIADEVYRRLAYDESHAGVAAETSRRDLVISVRSFSKTYAMTGWRIGWFVGPPAIVDAARQFQQATTTCAPSVSQHAALAALRGPGEPIEEMIDAFRLRRRYVLDRIDEIPAVSCPVPEGGFYAFLDVSELGGSSFEIAERLLREYGVVTVPGSGFGEVGEGYVRVSFVNDVDRLELGFDRIERMVRAELSD